MHQTTQYSQGELSMKRYKKQNTAENTNLLDMMQEFESPSFLKMVRNGSRFSYDKYEFQGKETEIESSSPERI